MLPSKEQIERINELAIREIYEDLPDTFINFINSDVINYCLHQVKVGTKNEQSARVLNSWINGEIVLIDDKDKGKIKRFNRLESIWVNILVDARKFGIPLEALKSARKDLLHSPIANFSLLKFGVLDTILRKPKILMIYEDGFTNITPLDAYSKIIARANYRPHLNLKLQDYISLEFPNNAFGIDFKIQNAYENVEKMTLLYFLKTGDYKSIKLSIKEGDVRLIENSSLLVQNLELMKSISSWSFKKAEIIVSDTLKITITP